MRRREKEAFPAARQPVTHRRPVHRLRERAGPAARRGPQQSDVMSRKTTEVSDSIPFQTPILGRAGRRDARPRPGGIPVFACGMRLGLSVGPSGGERRELGGRGELVWEVQFGGGGELVWGVEFSGGGELVWDEVQFSDSGELVWEVFLMPRGGCAEEWWISGRKCAPEPLVTSCVTVGLRVTSTFWERRITIGLPASSP